MSAAEGASKASSPEQANEWAVRANERTDKRVAQYCSLYFWLVEDGKLAVEWNKKRAFSCSKSISILSSKYAKGNETIRGTEITFLSICMKNLNPI